MSFRPRHLLAALMAVAFAGIGKMPGGRPGAPRSHTNGGNGRGNQARIRRAAKRRRIQRARAPK